MTHMHPTMVELIDEVKRLKKIIKRKNDTLATIAKFRNQIEVLNLSKDGNFSTAIAIAEAELNRKD